MRTWSVSLLFFLSNVVPSILSRLSFVSDLYWIQKMKHQTRQALLEYSWNTLGILLEYLHKKMANFMCIYIKDPIKSQTFFESDSFQINSVGEDKAWFVRNKLNVKNSEFFYPNFHFQPKRIFQKFVCIVISLFSLPVKQ